MRCCNLLSLLSLLGLGSAWDTVVELPLGTVVGERNEIKTVTGEKFSVDSFLGVPFAKPPVGELRFRNPEPVEKWSTPFQARTLSKACYQEPDTAFPGFEGSEMWNSQRKEMSEDCLYLNIWRPSASEKPAELKTVMLWIFGGGFFSGSPSLSLYNGSVLAGLHDVIVVNINYRVSAFGFLFLDNKQAPGNMGLRDQQVALKWVYDNIESFGGDPEKITVFGESAGGASVTAHLIAPDSRRFVNRAIFQSGSMNEPWACKSKNYVLDKVAGFVAKLGCGNLTTDQRSEIFDCVLGKTTAEVSEAAVAQMTGFMDFGIVPICEDDHFFKGNALTKFKSGDFKKVPILAGVMKDEGSFWLFYYLSDYYNKDKLSLMSREDFVKAVKASFGGEMNEVLVAAITQYYDEQRWNELTNKGKCINAVVKGAAYRDLISQAIGDYHFVCSCVEFAHKMMQYDVPVYLYYFTHMSSQNPWPDWSGAQHGYEIEFEFGAPLVDGRYTEEELSLSQAVMRFWADFAKNGSPTEVTNEWPPANEENTFRRLETGNETGSETLQKDVKGHECRLWYQIGNMTGSN